MTYLTLKEWMEDQKQSHKLPRVIKVVESYDYLRQERIWYHKGRKRNIV